MAFSVESKLIVAMLMILGTWTSTMSRELNDEAIAEKFEQWKSQYGRNYLDSAEEEIRRKVFKDNLKHIEDFNNAGNRTYKLGLNQFADLTKEEFLATHTGYKMPSQPATTQNTSFTYGEQTEVPESIDWREKGIVTPIKFQGSCGSCWAFAAVAAVEAIVSGKVVLSEQQLVDCVTANNGCDGGSFDNAFEYIMQKGITSESEYPYTGSQGMCQDETVKSYAQITQYVQVTPNSEEELKNAVAKQPLSVAIDASNFRFYSGGVFTEECGTQLNHAVTAIGYGGTSEEGKYWLLKNSWGESWGESGYMRLQRDVDAQEGLCGIAMHASYPIGKST